MNMQTFGQALWKKTPLITSILSCAGVSLTAYFSAKGGAKAQKLLEEAACEELSFWDELKITWKCYIPAAICASLTMGGIITTQIVDQKQQASLVGLYAAADQTFKKYQDRVKEMYGEETHKKIMDSLDNADDSIEGIFFESWFNASDIPVRTFYDHLTERRYLSSIERELLAQALINRDLQTKGIAWLADYYAYRNIDLPAEKRTLCWYRQDHPWIDFSNHVDVLDDGFEYCCVDIVTKLDEGVPF